MADNKNENFANITYLVKTLNQEARVLNESIKSHKRDLDNVIKELRSKASNLSAPNVDEVKVKEKTENKPQPKQERKVFNTDKNDNFIKKPFNKEKQFNKEGFKPKKPGLAPAQKAEAPSQLPNKKNTSKKKVNKNVYEDKKSMNKKSLVKRGYVSEEFDEDRDSTRRFRTGQKKTKEKAQFVPIKIERAVISTEMVPIKVLSEKLGITAVDITKRLFKEGIMKTINDSIDYETAQFIAADLNIDLEYKPEESFEDILNKSFKEEVDEKNLVTRPPVVTIMGHVDHGKTSLLDYIRHTQVASGEAGGITQHIGASVIEKKGHKITFIDTPGHEAFTSMRARGANITDIAVLIVAADDGVMPQTVESINHAKAAGVPIIVAVNKMDKPNANPDIVLRQLADLGVLCEDWGGDTIMCKVSAKTGEGVDNLLDMILLVAEMKELKANPKARARGTVLEAKLDNSKGPIANILIQDGTLNVSDTIIAGTAVGRIRAMTDDKGRDIKHAGPSQAVSILGLGEVPQAGDSVFAVDDKLSKQVVQERLDKIKQERSKSIGQVSLDDAFEKIAQGQMKSLNLIIKADVQGSAEAVKQSLAKISNEEAKVSVIHAAVGAINESDISLASVSNAVIIGFNVRPDSKAKALAEQNHIEMRMYRVIYDAIEDIENALKGMLAPKFAEKAGGTAEVRQIFKFSGVGTIAGSYVTEGTIERGSKARLVRNGVVIYDGELSSLKHLKDDVKTVQTGFECGITLLNYNDIKEGDVIETYSISEVK